MNATFKIKAGSLHVKSIFSLPTLCILLSEHISCTEARRNFLFLVSALLLSIALFKLLLRIFPFGSLSQYNRYDGEVQMEGNLVHVPCTCYDIHYAYDGWTLNTDQHTGLDESDIFWKTKI